MEFLQSPARCGCGLWRLFRAANLLTVLKNGTQGDVDVK